MKLKCDRDGKEYLLCQCEWDCKMMCNKVIEVKKKKILFIFRDAVLLWRARYHMYRECDATMYKYALTTLL